MDNPIREALKNLPGHWHKGRYSDGNGNFCGWGHIGNALDSENWHSGLAKMFESEELVTLTNNVALEQFPHRAREGNEGHFPSFNDHPNTTEDDVIMVFEKAAIKWEENHG